MATDLGKKAEQKIREWLNKPELGYSFDRIPDQMTGFYGSKNICDFTCFKSPNMYYIESKATYDNRFSFHSLTDTQYNGLLSKSSIPNVHSLVIVLFASEQRAFAIDIREIQKLLFEGTKSINITKIDKWKFKYREIKTIPSHKSLLDYTGDIEEYII